MTKYPYVVGSRSGSSITASGYGAISGGYWGKGGGGFSVTEAETQTKFYSSVTLSKLAINVITNTYTVDTYLRTRVNGADGNQLVTIPATTTGIFEDASNTDSIAADDLVNVSATVSGGSGGLNFGGYRVLAEEADPHPMIITSGLEAEGALITHYIAAGGRVHTSSPETLADFYVTRPMILDRMRIVIIQNSLTQTTTLRLMKNGANGNQTLSIPSATTGAFEDTTNDDSLSTGDALRYKLDCSTSFSGTITPMIFQLRSAVGVRDLISGWHRDQNSNLVFYPEIEGWMNLFTAFGADTEANNQITPGVAGKLARFTASVNSNTVNASSTAAVRIASADTAMVVTIPASTTGRFSDLVNVASIGATDVMNYRVSTGGSSGSAAFNFLSVGFGEPVPLGGAFPRWRADWLLLEQQPYDRAITVVTTPATPPHRLLMMGVGI